MGRGTYATLSLLVALACVSLSVAQLPHFFMGMKNFRPLRDHIAEQLIGGREAADNACDGNRDFHDDNHWTQPLDHNNTRTGQPWKQYFHYNDQYFNSSVSSPVVFLMLGGEAPIEKQWVCWTNYTYIKLAAQYQARIVQLEHRFFGRNNNKTLGGMSVSNLKYLTSEQALADAHSFIQGFSKNDAKLKGTTPKWVIFGGSYPGSLAAWMRKFYPGDSVGNVASSAPLTPVLDFFQYAAVMENTILTTGQDCYNATKAAFAALVAATKTTDGCNNLTTIFRLTNKNGGLPAIVPPLAKNSSQDDVNTLYSNIFGAFQDIIQYTYDARNWANLNGLDIATACKNMTDTSEPDLLRRLANVVKLDGRLSDPTGYTPGININYQYSLFPLQQTNVYNGAGRGWLWLSCNEFGWGQTTDTPSNFFSNVSPLSYYAKICQDLFNSQGNFLPIDLDVHVTRAEQHFGNAHTFRASNVILPNGALDPWSSLGADHNVSDQHQVVVLTPGAAHCSDMYPQRTGEPAGLVATRQLIAQEVAYYLLGNTAAGTTPPAGNNPPSNSTNTTPTAPPATTTKSAGASSLSAMAVVSAVAALLLSQ